MSFEIKMSNLSRLLTLLIFSLILCNGLYSQSLRKTFNYIEKGDIDKAVNEVSKFNENIKKSGVDFTLYGIASCLITNNLKYQKYDPYKSLEMFDITAKIEANKGEVDKFLEKYSLSIEKVHEMIYQNILKEAKNENTEESYKKTLSVCNQCFYEKEVINLQEDAAYNEAKSAKSVSVYKYFLNAYPDSKNKLEIKERLNDLAYLNAKSQMTLKSLNEFISEYAKNGNKYYNIAKHLCDSIAFSKINKSYSDYQNFLIQYPGSDLRVKIDAELPDLLYNQAVKENNIGLIELFLKNYPIDNRSDAIKVILENAFYESLREKSSLVEFEAFKRKFPNSKYIQPLSELYKKRMENNDLMKAELKGPVKSISATKYSNNSGTEEMYLKQFNEFGKLISINPGGISEDVFKDVFWKTYPGFFDNEGCLLFAGGMVVSEVDMMRRSSGTGLINFEYNSNGQLTYASDGINKWEFFYDADGNLITKDISSREGSYENYYLNYRFKYAWENGKLKYKHVFTPDGNKLSYYDVENIGNKQTIIYSEGGNNVGSKHKITVDYNNENLIIGKVDEELNHEYTGDYWISKTESTYSYINGKLINIQERKALNKSRVSMAYNDSGISTWSVTFTRDSFGQITSLGKGTEWAYKYDSNGNWVERTQYSIKSNDIVIRTVAEVVKRTISYY